MKLTIAAIAVSMLFAGSATAQEAWGIDEVDAYVKANRPKAASQVEDPFAVPAAAPTPGQYVVMRHSVPMTGRSNGSTSPVTWKYDPAAQTMTVEGYASLTGTLLSLDFQGQPAGQGNILERPRIHGVSTSEDRSEADAGTGQNAYGAQVKMTRETIIRRGFGEMNPGMDSPIQGNDVGGHKFSHTWAMAPEEARALSEHLVWEVVGETKPWAPGKWVICGTDYSGATVRNPIIRVTDACYLTGVLQGFRLVDSRDGSVLRQWGRTPANQRRRY